MEYQINEQVYLNGTIKTNTYPNGIIGINNLKTIFVTNIKGTVHHIETPSIINQYNYLYTIKILQNLYAIEVKSNQLSKNFLGINTNYQNPFNSFNPFNPFNPYKNLTSGPNLNPLTNIDDLSQLNKLNYLNSQIQVQNLNANKNVQKTISKFFYYKLVDEWLYKKLFSLLAFVEIINDKPQLIKSMNKYSVENLVTESERTIKIRANYLEENIITKKLVKQILKKIVKNMCLNWYDLYKHENTVSKIFLKYFEKLLEKSINSFNYTDKNEK